MKRQLDRLPKFFLCIIRRLFIYEEMFTISKDFEIEYAGICQYRGRIIALLWLFLENHTGPFLLSCFYCKREDHHVQQLF